MKKISSLCLLLILLATGIAAQPQPEKYAYDLSYFLPKSNYKIGRAHV